jgi:3-oxoacyl-[acyl-carrier protein] reductase
VALALAEAGADVVVNYRERAPDAAAVAMAIRALGRRALAIAADVADGEARCLSKKLSGAASGRVSDFAVVGAALGVETDVANRRPVADLA